LFYYLFHHIFVKKESFSWRFIASAKLAELTEYSPVRCFMRLGIVPFVTFPGKLTGVNTG
jgi:hypothetical protein